MAEDSLIKGQNREIERDISMRHFYETFLHLSQNIYHAIWKKKQLRGDKKNGNSNNSSIVASATPSYNVCYLASQLCVCVCVCVCLCLCLCLCVCVCLTQNQNELKKAQRGCVVRIYYFVKISVCDSCPNLMTIHIKWSHEDLTQGI